MSAPHVEENSAPFGDVSIPAVSRPSENPRALLIAFHYPPCGTSSGLHRTLCFSRDLRSCGWSPVVLSAHPRAYRESRSSELDKVPADVPVARAFALDSVRHLSYRGRYAGWMALPDAWITWLAGALPAGLRLIRKWRPRVLWSTYPIATAHLIGLFLHRLTGLPWVADFRDPMTEMDPASGQKFPLDPLLYAARSHVERHAIQECQSAVFVTPGALNIYRERYPQHRGKMQLIANGYDEQSFVEAEHSRSSTPRASGPLQLVHSGTLYPGPDRDATSLLQALARLQQAGKISPGNLRVRLRATGHDDYYRTRISESGVGDLVSLEPSIPYHAALQEMLDADGLLLFQGSTSNPAVPAKLYEYLRARRPIFAMVDKRGETAAVLRQAGVGTLVPLDSSEQIAAGLLPFLEQVRSGTAPIASGTEIARHSRVHKAFELSRLFSQVAADSAARADR